jgi:methylglutaconyl-CoA hydratase
MNEFVVSEIEIILPKLHSERQKAILPGAILKKLAHTILDEGAKDEVKAILK